MKFKTIDEAKAAVAKHNAQAAALKKRGKEIVEAIEKMSDELYALVDTVAEVYTDEDE